MKEHASKHFNGLKKSSEKERVPGFHILLGIFAFISAILEFFYTLSNIVKIPIIKKLIKEDFMS